MVDTEVLGDLLEKTDTFLLFRESKETFRYKTHNHNVLVNTRTLKTKYGF